MSLGTAVVATEGSATEGKFLVISCAMFWIKDGCEAGRVVEVVVVGVVVGDVTVVVVVVAGLMVVEAVVEVVLTVVVEVVVVDALRPSSRTIMESNGKHTIY